MSDTIPQETPLRQCTKCERWFPPTKEFFHALKTHADGLHSHCKECRNLYHRQFREVKPDPSDKEKDHRKYLKRRDAALEYRDRYYQSHQDEIKQYMRSYKRSHRTQFMIYNRNREAMRRVIPGKHTEQDIQDQYQRQKGKCYYCKAKLGKERGISYQVDHVIPLTRDGSSHDPWNIVIACPHCNSSKNDKLPHEWPEGGRLL